MKRMFLFLVLIMAAGTAWSQDSLTLGHEKLLDLYQTQRYAEAVQYLQNNYKADTENPKELLQLAYAHLMAGNLAGAEKSYLKLYSKDTANLTTLYGLAEISIRRGNPSKAKTYYLKVLNTDTTNYLPYRRLSELTKDGPENSRLQYLLKANALNPADAETAAGLAELHLKMNSTDKAAAVLKPALQADSVNLKLLEMTLPISIIQKRYAEAISTGQKLLSYGDSSAFNLNNLGKAYYLSLDYANSLKSFLMVRGGDSDDEALYYNIARSYRSVKDHKNAIPYLQKAIKKGVSPLMASYYGLLGDSFENTNKNEEASKAYQKGLDFENDGSLLYNIALLYETKLNDKKNAVSYYEQYLKTIDAAKQPKLVNFIKGKINDLKR